MSNESILNALPKPAEPAVLDDAFRPAALAERALREAAEASGDPVKLMLALEQADGTVSRYDSLLVPEGHELAEVNASLVERLVKGLLWARGGCKLYLAGPATLCVRLVTLWV